MMKEYKRDRAISEQCVTYLLTFLLCVTQCNSIAKWTVAER